MRSVAVTLAVTLVGCSSPRLCVPGEQRMCLGSAGCLGVQTCDARGAAFVGCVCAGADGGAGGVGGGAAGGSGGGGATGGGADAGCPLACGSGCCDYGQLCGTDGGCSSDFDPDRRPYCEPCSGALCGTGLNFCLLEGNHSFCGVDCTRGQACPAGYTCQDVSVVLTQWACSRVAPACPSNPALACSGPQDCARGVCIGGSCAGECVLSDGDPTGFCSCQVDTDCQQNQCSAGECSLTRGACVAGSDCPTIRCVPMATDAGTRGACLIGKNCAPAPGLTCADVR